MPCELCHMMASQRKCRLVCTSAEQRPPRNIIVVCAYFGSFFLGGMGDCYKLSARFPGNSFPRWLATSAPEQSLLTRISELETYNRRTGDCGGYLLRTRSICSSHNLQTVNCLYHIMYIIICNYLHISTRIHVGSLSLSLLLLSLSLYVYLFLIMFVFFLHVLLD